ncbi:hypothetical protein J6TS2_42440 [Heyndrickxia sporothermodurans]|nr:hypothetical protein J6TS2_42440 [Heyndrickxia sporothermodurans]
MKKLFKKTLLFLSFAVLLFIFDSNSNAASAEELNIATFNIFSKGPNSTGMSDSRLNSIRNLIRNENLDFIGLQEVDNNNTSKRNIGKNLLSQISDSKTIFPYQIYGQTLEINGGQYGNGMLTKNRVRGELVKYLPKEAGAEQRSYQRVVLEKNGYFVAVYNTHLSHENSDLRKTQIDTLVKLMNNDPIPNKILMGDFNVSSTNELVTFENNGYKIVKDQNNKFINTFPTNKTTKKPLDFIIVSKNINILNAETKGTYEHSDHHILKAKIKLSERGDSNLRFENNGQIMFTSDKNGYLIRAEEYNDNSKRLHAWEYYPDAVYGKHGNQIKYIFDIGSYGNVTNASRRIQGTKTIDRRYTYYPNAKYGIHGTKIKSSLPN